MYVRCESPELSFFWTASEWATECDICDEPRIRIRFRWYNSVVLHYTNVRRVIGEQWGYVVEISFRLSALHKSMLYPSLLDEFRTYRFL
jgi:hypothetical protein